jgi:hypothetical protein
MTHKLNFNTHEIDTYFEIDEEDKDKYLVLTCAKNEDKYIVEFIEHYLKLGFDKVIIADNNDEPSLEVLLQDYITNGKVQIFNCRGFGSFQVQLYACFANHGFYKWCGYFDADEFLEIGKYRDIKSYLKDIEEPCVLFHWICYGSNGEKHYKDKPVTERFPLPVSPIVYFKENCFVKSIVRGGDYWKGCWFNGSHLPYFDEDKEKNVYSICGRTKVSNTMHCRYPIIYTGGHLKHYYTKSFDEWLLKSNRGWPDGTSNLRNSTFFAFENIEKYDYNKIKFCAFGGDSEQYDKMIERGNYKEVLDKYSVLLITNESRLIYSIILHLLSLMRSTTNHTFAVKGEHIDDTSFTLMLDFALQTGNKLVYVENNDEMWQVFLSNKKFDEDTYYIYDFS